MRRIRTLRPRRGPPGPTGPVGEAGPPGGQSPSYTADAAVSGQHVVISTTTGVLHADPTDLAHAWAVLGISENAANQGDSVAVKTNGVMQDNSFSFTPGLPVFLGLSGTLVHTVPTEALFWLCLGGAVATDKLIVFLAPPIFKA